MSIVTGSVQVAYKTVAQWTAWNGIPLAGQLCYSSDTFYGSTNCPKFKVGNGVDTWANLDYHPDTTGASGIDQLTGDVTAGPGSGSQAATLATVNANVGSFTNASVTVNGKGLVTAASSGAAPVTSVTGTAPISSTGGATPAISLNNTAVTPGSYTLASITVDAQGRLTAASNGASSSGKLVWAGYTTTVVSAAGAGYAIANNIKFGSITLPANTVQTGDIIRVAGHWYVNQGGSYALAWYLRPTDTVPVLNTDYTSAVWHEMVVSGYNHGFENVIYANANSCYTPSISYAAPPPNSIGVGIHNDMVTNSGAVSRYGAISNAIDWTAANYFTFGCYSAAANTTRFQGAHVLVIRP